MEFSLSLVPSGPPVNVTCNIFINSFGSITETTMVRKSMPFQTHISTAAKNIIIFFKTLIVINLSLDMIMHNEWGNLNYISHLKQKQNKPGAPKALFPPNFLTNPLSAEAIPSFLCFLEHNSATFRDQWVTDILIMNCPLCN